MPLKQIAACLLLGLLLSTASAASIMPPLIEPEVGGRYFTRYNLWQEKDRHSATKYSRGTLVPVNSVVTLLSLGGKKMQLRLDGGQIITVTNREKFTKRSIAKIASEMLSPKALSLGSLSNSAQQAIAAGQMRLGMTREEVLIARGYPPRHRTPSLDDSTWVYWSSKFVKRAIVFENGVLVRGRGLSR